eukprot:jgi/Undpi1/9682/HiC_scaffold_27.g12138.m1
MRLDSDTICEADGYLEYRESHSECVGTSSHTRVIQPSCAGEHPAFTAGVPLTPLWGRAISLLLPVTEEPQKLKPRLTVDGGGRVLNVEIEDGSAPLAAHNSAYLSDPDSTPTDRVAGGNPPHRSPLNGGRPVTRSSHLDAWGTLSHDLNIYACRPLSHESAENPAQGNRRTKGKVEGVATEDTGSEGGSNSSTIRSEAGVRSEEVPRKVPLPILSFENDMAEAHQVYEDMPFTMRSVLEGSSFQEKCGLLGVAPRESGLCVQTAAGPGGARGPGKVSWATAAGPALALLQGNLAHAGPVATTVPAPASRTSAAREYTEADRVIGRVKRELHQAEGAKVVNHTALEMERATMGRRAESQAQRRTDLAAVGGKVAASNRAVRNAEGALSGATETYGQDHHAFVTKRGREINLNRFIPHMRTVREAARATMIAENARLLPSRDPPPAFDPANPWCGRAAPLPPLCARNQRSRTEEGGWFTTWRTPASRTDMRDLPQFPLLRLLLRYFILPLRCFLHPLRHFLLRLRASGRRAGAPSCGSGASPFFSGAPSCPGATGGHLSTFLAMPSSWPSRRPSTRPRGRAALPGVDRGAADTLAGATPPTVQAGETGGRILSINHSINSRNHGRLTWGTATLVGGQAVEAPITADMGRDSLSRRGRGSPDHT